MGLKSYQCALAAEAIYDERKVPQGWQTIEETHNSSLGFKAAAYSFEQKGEQYVIVAYRGTKTTRNFFITDSQIASRSQVGLYEPAEKFYDVVKKKIKDTGKSIILTGHSMGAVLAELVALTNSVKAITFESPGSLPMAHDLPGAPRRKELVKTFLSLPSAINSLNPQVGLCLYLGALKEDVWKPAVEAIKATKKNSSKELKTWHSMTLILLAFNAEHGYRLNKKYILKFPSWHAVSSRRLESRSQAAKLEWRVVTTDSKQQALNAVEVAGVGPTSRVFFRQEETPTESIESLFYLSGEGGPYNSVTKQGWRVTVFNWPNGTQCEAIRKIDPNFLLKEVGMFGHSLLLIEGIEEDGSLFYGTYHIYADRNPEHNNNEPYISAVKCLEGALHFPPQAYEQLTSKGAPLPKASALNIREAILADKNTVEESLVNRRDYLKYNLLGGKKDNPFAFFYNFFNRRYDENDPGMNCLEWCRKKMEVGGVYVISKNKPKKLGNAKVSEAPPQRRCVVM